MDILGKKKLGNKIVFNTLAMLLMVSLISAVVVSIIIQRQNRASIREVMNHAVDTLRYTVIENRDIMLTAAQQMVAYNKIGETLVFLDEYKDSSFNSGLTQDSFNELIVANFKTASSRDLWKVAVYDSQGHLLSFAFRESQEGYRIGFLEQGQLHQIFVDKEKSVDTTQLAVASASENVWVDGTYQAATQDQARVSFQTLAEHLCLQVELPVLASTINAKTRQMEQKIVGTVVTMMRFDESFTALIHKLTGLDVAVFSGEKFSAGDVTDYPSIDKTAYGLQAGRAWRLEAAESRFDTIQLNRKGYFQSLLPIYTDGGYCGAFALLVSNAEARANNHQMIITLGIVALSCMLLALPLTWLQARAIVKPVNLMADRIKDIAEGEGDLTKRLSIQTRNELGQLGQGVNQFIDRLHAIIVQVKGNSTKLNASASQMAHIAESLADGANQTAQEATRVSDSTEEMNGSMTSIAAAMSQASENVNMVATATEEMSNTINEITQNASRTRVITNEAVSQAANATSQVEELGGSAREIGKVIETITEISEQVNLLALNATIEAARAGDAGKGFAVVANEIKELARQTATATQEIKSRVDSIQQSTNGTVAEIAKIANVIKDINENVLVIASAVEEQSATTQHISENVSQAARGIGEVSDHVTNTSAVSGTIAQQIGLMTEATNDISQSSAQVSLNSNELSTLAGELDRLVGMFKV